MDLSTALLIVFLVILIVWYVRSDSQYVIIRPPGWWKAENLDPNFDPKYDRTFHQSVLDRQMDKMRDTSKYGMTVDDYLLGNLLQQNHGVVKS